jgi:hypothetical protein
MGRVMVGDMVAVVAAVLGAGCLEVYWAVSSAAKRIAGCAAAVNRGEAPAVVPVFPAAAVVVLTRVLPVQARDSAAGRAEEISGLRVAKGAVAETVVEVFRTKLNRAGPCRDRTGATRPGSFFLETKPLSEECFRQRIRITHISPVRGPSDLSH